MGREIVIGLHFYQPPREAIHPEISKISTDPEGKNWTEIIDHQCYEPLAQEGVLEKVSYDIYQTLLIQLEKISPETASMYKKSMEENGVGESFIHPILPDLSEIDKSIVIASGVKRFKEITGQTPKIFWPPETAIDTDTLNVLSENGYEGFVCAPEQIVQQDGFASDNRPTIIALANGKQLIAYPFDRAISSLLAFDPKQNADTFANNYLRTKRDSIAHNQVIIAWTDAETFGHHYKNGDKFLDYLLNSSLPSIGLYPTSINSLSLSNSNLPHGQIRERSAWSCPHGNLIRWSGSCDCGWGEDTSWKQPFTESMDFLNNQVSKILHNELGPGYDRLVVEKFYDNFTHPETVNNPRKALISAKISSLIAKTSCATFFSSPDVSGKINLLYAYQSLLYLKDSGLQSTSRDLEKIFYKKLSNITYPNCDGTALTALQNMLES